MTLEPSAYPCGTHGEDLTRDVHDELERMPVAGFATDPTSDGASAAPGTPFTVLVTCPGPDPHDLVFKGRIVGNP